MSKLIINGGKQLHGKIKIHGAKNSALPLLAATVLCGGKNVLKNCPNLSDITAALDILKHLGCKCAFKDNVAYLDTTNLQCSKIPDKLMRRMRSSVVFLGALLGRCGYVVLSSPGGCELGPRPIDLHISALKKLGAVVNEKHGYLEISAPTGLVGTQINLSFASVGATENIILASVLAKGVTTIYNAAKEPEIVDLANFLNKCGACIGGAGTDTIIVCGVEQLYSCTHTVIPDRIETVTYMAAAAITGGEITLTNVIPSHITAVNSVFEEVGCDVVYNDKTITIAAPKRLKNTSTIRTSVYPGFPTDAGPIILSMLSVANGTSVLVENIFENRFRYIDELKRLGANVKIAGKVAIIEGVSSLSGACCRCTDLRGGAALVLAGLKAQGTTVISDIYHIARGYEDIDIAMASLGADIKII